MPFLKAVGATILYEGFVLLLVGLGGLMSTGYFSITYLSKDNAIGVVICAMGLVGLFVFGITLGLLLDR